MDYLLLKHVHTGLALISIFGFVVRWCWRMVDSPLSSTKLVRILPHVIDTVFLATAFGMLFAAGYAPIGAAWLTAKITGLVCYILLGMVAMHTAPSIKRSLPAFIAAVLVFTWIVSVARLKTPQGLLALIFPLS